MLLDMLRDLHLHQEWADALMWRTIPEPRAGAPDPRLRDLLFHIHYTQYAFINLWNDQPREKLDSSRFATLIEIHEWARPQYPRIQAHLASLDEAALSAPLLIPWSRFYAERVGREPAMSTVADNLMQLAAHSSYHRAQVNARLKELGIAPPMVDYIAWVWAGRPLPAWTL